MHTYARGFTCIRQHLKEKVLWGTIMLSEMGKQNKQAKTSIVLSCVQVLAREVAILAAWPRKKQRCLVRILRTLRELSLFTWR